MRRFYSAVAAFAVLLSASYVSAAPAVGQPAPDFTLQDSHGQGRHLSDYKGKYVVLEWFNHACPFVHKHYDSGNMQKLQKNYEAKGVVWFSIISSAPGKEGFVTAADANKDIESMKAAPTAVLLDPKGTVAKLYEAKTTPDMFVIDPQGQLIYKGAIDDKPTTDIADVTGAKNYVSEALDAAMSGKPVAVSATTPYGCSVKYKS